MHVPGVGPHSNELAPGQDTHSVPHTRAAGSSHEIPQASAPSQPPHRALPFADGSGHGVQRVPHVATEDDDTQALPQACWSDGQRQTWSVPQVWPVMEQSPVVAQPVLQMCVTASQYFPAAQPVTSHHVGPGVYGVSPLTGLLDPEDEQATIPADARRTKRRVRIR